ncbi:urease accessory protein UreD [Segetibacter aerophilus]|uniref:Urease accessory protein UreD n=1 Tax=Segetibacter aerophilus TaxID=670293 RepID=A0A512BE12_9BACT|nr:urease accessory protein UreD [Segetibacter aerophilus]GEO10206.1 urease accessory protein UreD [Segetibacter aerophilus]
MITRSQITAGLSNSRTYLKNCFFTTPLKIANITENKNDHCLQLMLMSSSPGVLDGDEYQIKINLEEDCSLQLGTQSYQRLFEMKKGALQTIEVQMSKGASFCYLPHPSVPHKSSHFVATNNIYMSGGCSLTWGEVLTCGRKLNGEEFAFTKYQNLTKIFLNRRLMVKENLLIIPSQINVKSIGQLEGFTHQASLIYINETASVTEAIAEINNKLSVEENICFGVSGLPVNGVIVRLLGHKAEQLYNCLQDLNELLLIKQDA